MTSYWGVIFDLRSTGPRLDELPQGTFALRDPHNKQWYIMWPSP